MDRVFSFLLWPKREARGPWKQGRKKRGSITCPTDWANEANKMFIIWLCWLFRFWNGDRELEVHTATYGPGVDQSQHAKSVSHIINTLIDCHFRQQQIYGPEVLMLPEGDIKSEGPYICCCPKWQSSSTLLYAPHKIITNSNKIAVKNIYFKSQ